MQLCNNKRVKADVVRYEQAIQKITNQKNKIYYTKIFEEYKNQITIIDNNHNSRMNAKIDPKTIREDVIRLQELRWQLDKLLN